MDQGARLPRARLAGRAAPADVALWGGIPVTGGLVTSPPGSATAVLGTAGSEVAPSSRPRPSSSRSRPCFPSTALSPFLLSPFPASLYFDPISLRCWERGRQRWWRRRVRARREEQPVSGLMGSDCMTLDAADVP